MPLRPAWSLSKLDVIANNWANVNTVGFKKDRANFEDLFYRNEVLPSAEDSQGQLTAVGIQIGLDSRVSSVQSDFTQGAFQQIGGKFDLAIEVNGLFRIDDPATGQNQLSAVTGNPEILTGSNTHSIETSGVFNTLVRLEQALLDGDIPEIERLAGLMDEDFANWSLTQGELGARNQILDVLERRLEDEDIELRSVLSNELDVDLVEAISSLSARLAAFEASLRLAAQSFRLSLLNFL